MFAHHAAGLDVITPGWLGAPFTVMHLCGLAPQAFDAVTQTVPDANGLNVVFMALLPCPLLIIPDGLVQLNVAPACAGHE